MKYSKILIAALVLPVALLSCKPTDEQIQKWVENNPDKILKVLMEYQQKQQADQQPKAEDVKANSAALFENAESPSAGTGSIKIAYFFDFNCGHCARQSETIKAVLAKTNKVQVIYKNLPVLGPSSVLAARAALAAHQQGKYFDFYTEAFKIREKNPDTLKAIAKKIKLDVAKWEKDMDSEAVNKEISHVQELAQKMKINGTPALAIAPDMIMPGRVDQLMEIVESIKQ
ncbi:thioredoxin domain-containing protein [bacterium]|nr:thioredoxin domain-containing protein [bacterium]